MTDLRRHDIELRDVVSSDHPQCPDTLDGCLVVSYHAVNDMNATYTEARTVSARLPVECLCLFDDGTLDPAALSADERDWLRYESGRHSNEIDFEATETATVAL